MIDRRAVGQRGEDLACEHLRGKGYRIVERNVRTSYGEIDIVAAKDNVLVFVEVRTVKNGDIMPEESVGPRKQRQVANLAIRYLQKLDKLDSDWRTDVIAIELGSDNRARRLDHITDAVELR